MFKPIAITFALALALPAVAAPQEKPAVEQRQELTTAEFEEAQAVFERLADDYRTDPMAIDGFFGIKLGDKFWTVEIKRKESATKRGRLTDHEFGLAYERS